MAYVKNTWVDQDVERPKTYEVTNNQDGSITLTDSFGLVTELGTPVNAVNMNHIEDGLVDTDVTKYNATTTYNAGEWVTGVVDNEKGIYASKVNNNTGNALTNDTYWEKVELGGGASRNIGEIVASTIPLTDAGLHLLDGALLQYGSYQAFIDYIAELYDSGDYDDIFETEANWQSAVTNYGVCGKFVYDSVNNTVRLPKYSNKIHTQDISSSAPVKGNGMTLGLTNGTTNYGLVQSGGNVNRLDTDTAGYGVNVGSSFNGSSSSGKTVGVTTDGTKSGIIADLANITTSLDGYYYIVIATSTKTDIQVDIDQIATDLNGKADVDLTNVNNSGTSRSAGWSMPSSRYINLTLGASGSNYTAPANGYVFFGRTVADTQFIALYNVTAGGLGIVETSSGSQAPVIYLPLHSGDTFKVTYTGTGATSTFRFVYAEGSKGEV